MHRAALAVEAPVRVGVDVVDRQDAGIAELIEASANAPVLDRAFEFEQLPEALSYLEKGRARGKVVPMVR
jgi:NADPH:quinone reductase-like Zn-dependent oxidoreductase